MVTLEEDLQYVLDRLRKLAFASLTPANIAQLQDSVQCVAEIRDASALGQEIVWILQDLPEVDSFAVEVRDSGVAVRDLELSEGVPAGLRSYLEVQIKDRMKRAASLRHSEYGDQAWTLSADRDALAKHIESVSDDFDAPGVLTAISEDWSKALIERLDQATAHSAPLHAARERMKLA